MTRYILLWRMIPTKEWTAFQPALLFRTARIARRLAKRKAERMGIEVRVAKVKLVR